MMIDNNFKIGSRVGFNNAEAMAYKTFAMDNAMEKWRNISMINCYVSYKIVEITKDTVALSPNGKLPITGWAHKKDLKLLHRCGLRKEDSGIHSEFEIILNKDQAELFYNNSTAKVFEDFIKLLPKSEEELKEFYIKLKGDDYDRRIKK